MEITITSDLHGHYPELEGGDLLIVAGDLTARDTEREYRIFREWIMKQDYDRKIFIGGNHDNWLQKNCAPSPFPKGPPGLDLDVEYLCDSGTDFEWHETHVTKWGTRPLEGGRHLKLKIWGSPWTQTFPGMNPSCMAYTAKTDEELAVYWSLIPEGTDILITHSPPWGVLDLNNKGHHCGSKTLAHKIGLMENPPKLWVWGHIHEAYGIDLPVRGKPVKMINASHVNEYYKPVNKPFRIEL